MQQFFKKWQDKTQLVDDKGIEWDEWVCFFIVNYGFLNMLYRCDVYRKRVFFLNFALWRGQNYSLTIGPRVA